MSIFRDLKTLHDEIESQYLEAEFNENPTLSDQILHKRKLNDSAYYLFMFTRLEGVIREKSSSLIAEKQSIPDWEQHRAWKILPKDKEADGISFLNRVALLVEGGRESHHYQKIKDYYMLRNDLAHGGDADADVSINISDVVTDFECYLNTFKL